MDINDIYYKVKHSSDSRWNVCIEGDRIIITCDGIFRCFIAMAYELRTRTSALSAHMLIYHDNLKSMSKLQCWTPSKFEKYDITLNKILTDLNNIVLLCVNGV